MLKRTAAALGHWLLAWAGAPELTLERSVPAAPRDPTLGVIEFACYLAGVDTSRFGPALDLSQSGKVPEILYITARELGPSHPLHTVGAIQAAFTR